MKGLNANPQMQAEQGTKVFSNGLCPLFVPPDICPLESAHWQSLFLNQITPQNQPQKNSVIWKVTGLRGMGMGGASVLGVTQEHTSI